MSDTGDDQDRILLSLAEATAARRAEIAAEQERQEEAKTNALKRTFPERDAGLAGYGGQPTSYMALPVLKPFAEFATDDDAPTFQRRLQAIHDAAAREAARVKPLPEGTTAFDLQPETFRSYVGRLGGEPLGSLESDRRWKERDEAKRARESATREAELVAEIRGLKEALLTKAATPPAPAPATPPPDPDRAAFFAQARRRATEGR